MLNKFYDPQCWECYRDSEALAGQKPPVKLKPCKGCGVAKYCSQDCQSTNWPEHKWICSPTSTRAAAQKAKERGTVVDLRTSLLHGHSEEMTFGHLIDCFRLRFKDANLFDWTQPKKDPVADFHRFLMLAEDRPGLLPTWWTPEQRGACKRLARDEKGGYWISQSVNERYISSVYQDEYIPLRLKMLARRIYGEESRTELPNGWAF